MRELAARVRPRVPLRHDLTAWLAGVRDVRYPLARYAGEVSYADEHLGHLREELERLGVAGRTIVLVTADHGESLGEHGIWFEHLGLHDPVVRVPLIIVAPGLAPARRADPASGLDVAPTVLALAGLPVPPGMRGRNLLAPDLPDVPIVSEAVRRQQVALVQGRWKLVRTEQTISYNDAFERDAGRVELYDLEDDPAELHDRADVEAARTRDLLAALDAWLDAHRAAPATIAPPVAPDRLDDLRALGYVE